MSELIDYSKYRIGSKSFGRKVEKCGKCGRKGTISRYKDSRGILCLYMCVHTAENNGFCLSVRDRCTYPPSPRTEAQ